MACNKDHSQIQRIMETLPTDQGGVKSPHAAFALGYYHGVCQRTNDDN